DPRLVIPDPIPGPITTDDAAEFELWVQGDGSYSVFTDGSAFFIDIEPRILKAGSRPGWTKLPGTIGVDTARIGVADLTSDRRKVVGELLASENVVIIENLEPGEYFLWFEEKQSANYVYRGVIGFGKSAKLILNGEWANELHSIEKRLAQVLRSKGLEAK